MPYGIKKEDKHQQYPLVENMMSLWVSADAVTLFEEGLDAQGVPYWTIAHESAHGYRIFIHPHDWVRVKVHVIDPMFEERNCV